tara:strand:- start:9 stop:518 length:510 start_codon:yes stop_codon:yes gene_type:complete
MISDYNIKKLFLVLLNRNPQNTEIIKYRNSNINDIKFIITESDEFKDFKQQNILKLREDLCKILKLREDLYKILKCENPNFNYEKMLKILIGYDYNFDIFYSEFKKKINNIHTKYESYYLEHLNIKKQIETNDLVEIINNDYEIESYIPTSEVFLAECRKRITELTLRI